MPILKSQASSIPQISEHTLSRINQDGSVSIINLDLEDIFYTIDGLASQVWLQINSKRSLNEIKNKMIEKHNPPLKRFQRDFSQLIETLKKEKLITFS